MRVSRRTRMAEKMRQRMSWGDAVGRECCPIAAGYCCTLLHNSRWRGLRKKQKKKKKYATKSIV